MTHDLCHFHFLSFSDKAIKEKLSLSLFFQRKHSSFVLLSLSVYFQIKLQRKDMDEPLTKDLTVALSLDICSNHSLTVREESLLSWKIMSTSPQVLSKRNDKKNIRERCWGKMIVYIIIIAAIQTHYNINVKEIEIFQDFFHFPFCNPLYFLLQLNLIYMKRIFKRYLFKSSYN